MVSRRDEEEEEEEEEEGGEDDAILGFTTLDSSIVKSRKEAERVVVRSTVAKTWTLSL